MNLPLSPDDGRTLILAIGVGAMVGVMLGGWIMTALHKLMLGAVKVALIAAVVVGGVWLWSGYQATSRATGPTPYRSSTGIQSSHEEPPPVPMGDRWWEEE